MPPLTFSHLSRLSDQALIRDLEALLVKERALEVDILAHVAEVDERKLFAVRGYDSMQRYCTEALGLSDSAAANRIHAARAARRFPVILDMLADGRLRLAGVLLLAPHLTPNNHASLLRACAGLSKREIEELVAEMFRAPVPKPSVARVPEPTAPLGLDGDDRSAPAPRRPRASQRPVRRELYEVRFTVDRELRDKLDELRALLRHQIPDGDLSAVLGRAIEHLLEETKRKRFAKTRRPRRSARKRRAQRGGKRSRHIPNAIRRAVYERDGGRCTYVAADGTRCRSRSFLELDHVEGWALHGRHSLDGIRLRCRAHNQLHARETYGAAHMKRFERPPGDARAASADGSRPPGDARPASVDGSRPPGDARPASVDGSRPPGDARPMR